MIQNNINNSVVNKDVNDSQIKVINNSKDTISDSVNIDLSNYIEKSVHIKELKQAKIEGHIEGRKEGHIEGRKEGHIEGRKEGHIEGRKEGWKKGLIQGIFGSLIAEGIILIITFVIKHFF